MCFHSMKLHFFELVVVFPSDMLSIALVWTRSSFGIRNPFKFSQQTCWQTQQHDECDEKKRIKIIMLFQSHKLDETFSELHKIRSMILHDWNFV